MKRNTPSTSPVPEQTTQVDELQQNCAPKNKILIISESDLDEIKKYNNVTIPTIEEPMQIEENDDYNEHCDDEIEDTEDSGIEYLDYDDPDLRLEEFSMFDSQISPSSQSNVEDELCDNESAKIEFEKVELGKSECDLGIDNTKETDRLSENVGDSSAVPSPIGSELQSTGATTTSQSKKSNVKPDVSRNENSVGEQRSNCRYHLRNRGIHKNKKKSFSCDQCRNVYITEEHLEIHKIIHSGNGLFTCVQCNEKFSEANTINIHYFQAHRIIKVHICDVCRLSFPNSSDLAQHKRIHLKQPQLTCAFCKSKFSKKSELQAHETTHKAKNSIICTVCKHSFKTIEHLHTHLRKHTNGNPFKCVICGVKLTTIKKLRAHLSKHKEYKPHFCKTCHRKFNHLRGFKQHVCTKYQPFAPAAPQVQTNSEEQGQFACTLCKTKLKTDLLLQKHLLTHKEDKTHVCKICHLTFDSPSSLEKHVCNVFEIVDANEYPEKLRHLEVNEKPDRTPDLSGTTTPKPNDVTISKENTSAPDPKTMTAAINLLTCVKCNNFFSCANDYENHEKLHLMKTCTICWKEFPRIEDLNVHQCIKINACVSEQSNQNTNIAIVLENNINATVYAGATYNNISFVGEMPTVMLNPVMYTAYLLIPTQVDNSQCNEIKDFSEECCGYSNRLKNHLREIKNKLDTETDSVTNSLEPQNVNEENVDVEATEKPFKCTRCPQEFSHAHQLEFHSRVHKEITEFCCDKCDNSAVVSYYLKLQKKECMKRFSCVECGARFSEHETLLQHKNTHTKTQSVNVSQPHVCTCPEPLLSSAANTADSQSQYTEENNAERSCDNSVAVPDLVKISESSATELGKDNSERHTNNYQQQTQNNQVKDWCGQSMDPKTDVAQPAEMQYKCNHCPKQFNFAHHLEFHNKLHKERLRFKCAQCSKKFKTASLLATHKKTHEVRLPFACDICNSEHNFTYCRMQHTQEHMIHKCATCSKKFASTAELETHKCKRGKRRSKPVARTFKCEKCPSHFLDEDRLKRHRELHNGYQVLPYERCKKMFTHAFPLESHKRTHRIESLNSKVLAKENKLLLCNHCLRVFNNESEFKSHVCDIRKEELETLRSSIPSSHDIKSVPQVSVAETCYNAFNQDVTSDDDSEPELYIDEEYDGAESDQLQKCSVENSQETSSATSQIPPNEAKETCGNESLKTEPIQQEPDVPRYDKVHEVPRENQQKKTGDNLVKGFRGWRCKNLGSLKNKLNNLKSKPNVQNSRVLPKKDDVANSKKNVEPLESSYTLRKKKSLKCEQCNKNFVFSFSLERHIKARCKLEHVCIVCGKEFKRFYNFKAHQRLHTREKSSNKK